MGSGLFVDDNLLIMLLLFCVCVCVCGFCVMGLEILIQESTTFLELQDYTHSICQKS